MADPAVPDDGTEPSPSFVEEVAKANVHHLELAHAYEELADTRRRVLRALFSDRDSNLVAHARRELELAGLFDADSDYDGMLAEAVMDLMMVFAAQGHSGFSAPYVTSLFSELASFKNLTGLDSDPKDWMQVGGEHPMWQSCRRPDAFSYDAGATWYYLDEPQRTNDERPDMVLHRRLNNTEQISKDGGATWGPMIVEGATSVSG